uniref:Uncharacterized protein n=1 Tax=Pseudo-nitzschia australis TaxID=44445 RepID=A0A7S4ERE1_9STRA|mmetsp:Transcript_2624/g.5684  ORF Transcript_2624/g.5684 Transcript_2624/m.5684 type:complete len:150 (-) Transcript_2624:162-611(-)|eukprot:CAMPEP_0168193244 /NCGR_PEP_ID=MMETSP0139_2-20121125/18497_1 /TAXON_ID=44445 /ORGANISM="Pseudo-nitzschia australis, Strain 10249 10 AB" /LENGTH=149 /DNA_ID=CAMNT_0008116575 /DNA_START=41 /DNA_END=490 /DNA_ORIENTATION=-
MLSLTKLTSEPNLYRTKSKGSNKPFVPIKTSSSAGLAASYKLSSRVRNILSEELQLSSSYGSDASLQPMNPRRRFQRRGSKSASMLKALSTGHLMTELLKNDSEQEDRAGTTQVLIQSMEKLSTESTTNYESSLGESTNTLSSHMEEGT